MTPPNPTAVPLIPDKFAALIDQCREGKEVMATLCRYENWISTRPVKLPLFPDFTDHGIRHLSAVAWLAEFLISDGSHDRPDSFHVFTPDDAAVLICAIVLHDIG